MIKTLGLNRRYIVLLVFLCVATFLWLGFYSEVPSVTIGDVRYVPSSYDWSKAKVFHPVKDMKAPPAGTLKTFPRVQLRQRAARQDHVTEARKQAVKRAFKKSWDAYKAHAWTKDELMPLSIKGKQTFSGWSAQLVDALDTLWIMGFKDDFKLAVKEVAVIDWSKTNDNSINLFEVTIRYLGGLIAAFDLSQDSILRAKAIELGDALYATFDTPNRLPSHWLSYNKAKNGEQMADSRMSGAAGGTLCLEFTRLTQITGDFKYYDATERLKQFFYRFQNETKIPGMWPLMMNLRDEAMIDTRYTVGAGADSMYEYLPKMHALLGGLDPQYEEMTIQSLDTIRDNLLYRPMTPKDDDVLMAGNAVVEDGKVELSAEMQHLTCFIGGMYGLAGKLLSRKDYVNLGSRLAAGCVWAYDAFPSGIMPEVAILVACEKKDGPCPYDAQAVGQNRNTNLPKGFVKIGATNYLQRPEAIESVFYMWRITGDQIWRDAAWRMWESIVRETETELAFAAVSDVRVQSSVKIDVMETFWMAETLKYFYLVFDVESTIDLDEWVFNTEAHPFKRPVPLAGGA